MEGWDSCLTVGSRGQRTEIANVFLQRRSRPASSVARISAYFSRANRVYCLVNGIYYLYYCVDSRSSPINFVKKARAPTLFYVGNRDFVCPAPPSFELWRALKRFGVDTELMLYSGEGHGLTQPADQRDITRQTVRWFSEQLRWLDGHANRLLDCAARQDHGGQKARHALPTHPRLWHTLSRP